MHLIKIVRIGSVHGREFDCMQLASPQATVILVRTHDCVCVQSSDAKPQSVMQLVRSSGNVYPRNTKQLVCRGMMVVCSCLLSSSSGMTRNGFECRGSTPFSLVVLLLIEQGKFFVQR